MPDSTEPTMDFAGLAAAAAHAFRPDFADVVARSGRRRRKRAFGALLVTLGLAAGGGTAVVATADHAPTPVRPAPAPSTGPWRTTAPQPGAQGPQPQPSYTRITPGHFDPVERDEPLTGLYTELKAGDIDHLYLEYRDCAGGACRAMLAASADRGRTWRKLPIPVPVPGGPGSNQPAVALVYGTLVLVADPVTSPDGPFDPRTVPPPTYRVSTDGGVTWRPATVRTVDALPAGWPVHAEMEAIVAVDPRTGDMARLEPPAASWMSHIFLLPTPPGAGMWTLGTETEPPPSPLPTGVYQLRSLPVARVSDDGGRTWDTRRLPAAVGASPGGGTSLDRSLLTTVDGRTVYVREERTDGIRLHASADGGRTWAARAELDLDGPMLSLLPVGDRTVIVEGLHGTYRSTDQGRTFTRVGPSLGARAHAVPGGYTIPTNNNEYSAWVSEDGAVWTYIRRPEVP